MIHGMRYVDEVFPELAGDVLIGRVLAGQLQRDRKQVECIHCHPTGAVGLLDIAAVGKRRATIEHAYVVQAEKSALKNIHSRSVLAVHPPSEVQWQLVE